MKNKKVSTTKFLILTHNQNVVRKVKQQYNLFKPRKYQTVNCVQFLPVTGNAKNNIY